MRDFDDWSSDISNYLFRCGSEPGTEKDFDGRSSKEIINAWTWSKQPSKEDLKHCRKVSEI